MKRAFWLKKFVWLKKAVYWLLILALVLVGGSVAASVLKVPGGYKFLVVQSGSMEPTIKRMGIVVVKPSEDYQKGDVITVSELANLKVSLTHRIVDIEEKDGKTFYVTKGDANEDADMEKRLKENVLGKVVLSVPYLGYPVSIAKTQTGFILMIIVPAVIIIYDELRKIKEEIVNLRKKK